MMNKNGKTILGVLYFFHTENSCGVAIGYCGTKAFQVVNIECNKNGRILILHAVLNGTKFLLINFYNSNRVWAVIYFLHSTKTIWKS